MESLKFFSNLYGFNHATRIIHEKLKILQPEIFKKNAVVPLIQLYNKADSYEQLKTLILMCLGDIGNSEA